MLYYGHGSCRDSTWSIASQPNHSAALNLLVSQNTQNLLDAISAQASVLPSSEIRKRARVPGLISRAAAHEVSYLHVPHGKSQISIGALVPDKPLGLC